MKKRGVMATDRVQAFNVLDVAVKEELEFIGDMTVPGPTSARTRYKRHDSNQGIRVSSGEQGRVSRSSVKRFVNLMCRNRGRRDTSDSRYSVA